MSFDLTNPCGIPFQNAANMGWSDFGQDFGGVAAWNRAPLHQDTAAQAVWKSAFQDMADNGCITVVRFWFFPELWTSDINYNGNCPTGTNGNLEADICKLLEIADDCGIQLQPTLIGFDGFKRRGNTACSDPQISATGNVPPTYISMYDIWNDGCWSDFCNNVIGPVVAAAENCPWSSALHSWDMFNEPDQVTNANITVQNYTANAGPGMLTAGQEFEAQDSNCFHSLDIVQMRALISELIACTRANSGCPITIGTNTKWHYAYSDLDIDFISLHTYSWQEPFFPTYTVDANSLTSTGLPVMMGEYPPANTGNQSIGSHPAILQGYCDNNYFGVMPWQYGEGGFGFGAGSIAEQNTFAESEIKRLSKIEISPSNVECGSSQTVTIKTTSGCGDHFDASGFTVANGSLSTPIFNAATCSYTATYTAPLCPNQSSVSIMAEDVDGNVGSGSIVVGDVSTEDCDAGTVISITVGATCIQGSVVIDCGSCSCVVGDPVQIGGVAWDCLPLGGYITLQVPGCDCGCEGSKQCGPLGCGYQYKPAWADANTVQVNGNIVTIGPKKGPIAPILCYYCEPCVDPDCPECP